MSARIINHRTPCARVWSFRKRETQTLRRRTLGSVRGQVRFTEFPGWIGWGVRPPNLVSVGLPFPRLEAL